MSRILILGGDNDVDSKTYVTFLSVEEKKNKWNEKKLTPFLYPRTCFGIVVYDNFLFIIGGFDGNRAIATVECYDFAMDTWTTYPSLYHRRSSCNAVINGTKIYVIGGVAKNDIVDSIEEFDLKTGKWTILTKNIASTSSCGSIFYNGLLYIFGGLSSESNPSNMLAVYDVDKKQWTILKPMHKKRCSFGYCLFFLNNSPIIVISGGTVEDKTFTDFCEYYDIRKKEWIEMGPFNQKKKFCSLVSHQDKLYVIGGNTENECVGTIECYNFETKKWNLVYENKKDILSGHGVVSFTNNVQKNRKKEIIINSTVSWKGTFKKNKRDGLFLRKEGDVISEFYFHDNILTTKEEYELEKRIKRLKIPNEYLCPISLEIMRDPVVTSTGNTYERKNIEKWFLSNNTDPLTNIVIHKNIYPNILIKKIIKNFLKNKIK